MAPKLDSKTRVKLLQRIMKVKGLLFDENRSVDEVNGEWKKIANFAKNELGMNRDYKYLKGPFMYGCKTSLARKLLNKKKMPLTRAHLLTMDILGKDSLKLLQEYQDLNVSTSTSVETSSDGDTDSSTASKENMEPKRRSKRMMSKAIDDDVEMSDDDEMRSMKKQKLALEIQYTQMKLDQEKEKDKDKTIE